MGGLYYEDYEVGAVYTTAARTVTEADVVTYAGLSGDQNALHMDEEYAKTTVFGTRIAHGLLGTSIAMGLFNRLGLSEGTSLAFLGIDDWRFLRPIFIGDTVRVRVTVEAKRLSSKGDRGVVRRRLSLENQRGEVVQEGIAVGLVACRPR